MSKGMERGKKWSLALLLGTFICLLVFGMTIVVIDPFFHYHAPIKGVSYYLNRDNERYQNYGILTNFSYDTIITGTSLTENFKTSEWDSLTGARTVKVSLAGATYKEINEQLEKAFKSDNEIKTVIRSLEHDLFLSDKDAMMENYIYPTYMTNDDLLDDVHYIFNKDVMFHTLTVLLNTIKGYPMTSFDTYANWMPEKYFGREYVLPLYSLGGATDVERELTQKEIDTIKANIRQNVTELIEAQSDTTFLLFIPPCSICYWDRIVNIGELSYRLEAEKIVIEELLRYPNVKLYSFANNFDMICNLNNYTDPIHYGDWINTQMLQWMAAGEYMLTEDNYLEYLESMENFLRTYDYTALRQED